MYVCDVQAIYKVEITAICIDGRDELLLMLWTIYNHVFEIVYCIQ